MELLTREELLPKRIPDLATIMESGRKKAQGIKIAETLMMKTFHVVSELEYKRRKIGEGCIMRHSNMGWNSWEKTKRNCQYIYNELQENGIVLDRVGFILDWIMGLPKEERHKIPKGTGLVFNSLDEWKEVGQVVPAQPHFGDHMIGSMNSVENVQCALSAGATTIGNLSHFYTYEYPGFGDQEYRVVDMLESLAIMSVYKERGAMVHSNLDDGYGAQLHDIANITGWAMLENYMVDHVIGAKVAHCFGNLFTDPIMRLTFVQILDEIHQHKDLGSMIYGNTLDYTLNYDNNYAILSSYLSADMIGQICRPTGHAIVPIPITEAARIPSPDDIVQVHKVAKAIEVKAREMTPLINWEYIEKEKEKNMVGGQIFFERIMNALDDCKIDINHPGEVFLAIKRIGAPKLEEYFGAGKRDKFALRHRIPVSPTGAIKEIQKVQNDVKQKVQAKGKVLHKIKVIVAATDVHEFAKEIVVSVLREAGAQVYDLGTSVPPKEIVDTVMETESKAVLISTYNGIALTYTKDLLKVLEEYQLQVPVIIGGLLNENQEDGQLAVDVSEDIKSLGVFCCDTADLVIDIIQKRITA